ncbi:hypothetical protein OS122_02495 [Mycolicibacterium mucogenicum]|uniref:hypothetical protein n=1 Tax=Mycolicibacterium mucogenicum TaxID=56689 RepID=UPI002269D705|nr:hypothetical protein [Mycolicibacterium mucogenicum]MCX8559768.1 hypothetical protein [Mycolicibacterium mucogenicum]
MIRKRHSDTIDIVGANGDFCRITDPDLTWGPYLAQGSKGLYDLAIQSNWGNYSFGQYYQSNKPKRRDVVWTIHLINPETGTPLDRDEHLWHILYSRWKAMFSASKEATVVYRSLDGDRTLGLRKTAGDQSFSTQNFEGIDPHHFAYGSIVQTMGAELPYYVGTPIKDEIQFDGAGNFWGKLSYYNPSTVDTFAQWDVTYGAAYVLPDYSYGNPIFGAAIADGGKTVLTPQIVETDGNVTIYTRPDMETYVSENDTPVGLRAGGRDWDYPIPAGAGEINDGCTVRAINVADGCAIKLTIPTWYDSPFSTPTVF